MASAGYMEKLGGPEYTVKAIALRSDGERVPFSPSIFDGGKEGLDFVIRFLQHTKTHLIDESGHEITLSPLGTRLG